ncbi:putative coiled-coil domain-containing protein [Apostichopus japonicus]|uniref:Putative coiled-coil domain-containing protein n=1 Tax=Stichopus japonicus TaxID=307972 RepID=A0A2G8LPT7_STIJA|nr:putative coiled-coil domain-containing protein [Apostichopus japonicus]
MANKRPFEQTDEERDLDRLQAELAQEKQMKEMLNQSIQDLQLTIAELEQRYNSVIDEGNEWKTRFENQEELNQLWQKQVIVLQERLEKCKESAKDNYENEMKTYDELSEASLRKLAKQLEREKASFTSQLKDYEWRLDQESKAFHKANEERKGYITELKQASQKLGHLKTGSKVQWDTYGKSPRGYAPPQSQASRSLDGNVPDNHRVLDPRKGPIKRTAAMKKLPKLDYHSS